MWVISVLQNRQVWAYVCGITLGRPGSPQGLWLQIYPSKPDSYSIPNTTDRRRPEYVPYFPKPFSIDIWPCSAQQWARCMYGSYFKVTDSADILGKEKDVNFVLKLSYYDTTSLRHPGEYPERLKAHPSICFETCQRTEFFSSSPSHPPLLCPTRCWQKLSKTQLLQRKVQ